MELPSKSLERAVQALSRLPGIGRRSALRLALHMLRQGNDRILDLSEALEELATNSQFCQKCHAISDQALCGICQDERRDLRSLCVVEDIRDVLALEKYPCPPRTLPRTRRSHLPHGRHGARRFDGGRFGATCQRRRH